MEETQVVLVLPDSLELTVQMEAMELQFQMVQLHQDTLFRALRLMQVQMDLQGKVAAVAVAVAAKAALYVMTVPVTVAVAVAEVPQQELVAPEVQVAGLPMEFSHGLMAQAVN